MLVYNDFVYVNNVMMKTMYIGIQYFHVQFICTLTI